MTPANISGLRVSTWNSTMRNPRDSRIASPSPSTTPTPTWSAPCRRNKWSTSRAPAPNAIRTPTSCVRRVTAKLMTPYTPMVASSSAAKPNTVNSAPNML